MNRRRLSYIAQEQADGLMYRAMPLKILLADTEYSQYLSLKALLSVRNGFRADIFWCGERDHYCNAILTGIYDLVLMDHSAESLLILEKICEDCCAPIVMLADKLDVTTFESLKFGALGVLDRNQPERNTLKHFLLCADLHRNGELSEQLSFGLSANPQKKYSQSTLSFVR